MEMPPSPSMFGLTGSVACGKSTVARFFRDLGAQILDADHIGHGLIEPGRPAFQEIVQRFGKEILDPAGIIDRRKLGARVFSEPEELRDLNAILHPRIIGGIEQLARDHQTHTPHGIVIVDAALIFEAGIARNFRKLIVVWCRPEQQLERLMHKAGVSREEAERRIRAQMPAEEKRMGADYLIDSSGSLEHTRQQTLTIYCDLRRITTLSS